MGKVITHSDYDYIYLSPHLDDVALSCGGSICDSKTRGCNILVVTLFSGDPPPPFPPLARACHQLWQMPEEVSPYEVRRVEDEKAMAALGVDYLWLDWLEVIYRDPTLSDFNDINDYTADVQHDPIFPILCEWLADVHATYPNAQIVVPSGIGGHRDHRIVFSAAIGVLNHTSLLFFEDFPYVAYLPEEVTELVKLYNLVSVEVDTSDCLEQRVHAVEAYQSQLAMLFYPPSSFRDMIRDYAYTLGGQQRFVERYWKFSHAL
jgi:LmbE family N-acetylglucosaminyl deacetylase